MDKYYPFNKPWIKPPYSPFKFMHDVNEGPAYYDEETGDLDLTPYLQQLKGVDGKREYKYKVVDETDAEYAELNDRE